MDIIYAISNNGCDARVEELRTEFGGVLAERIVEAEAVDFLWDARVKERYLGQHIDAGLGIADEEVELSRIAVLSRVCGKWHVAACLVDGEGVALDLLWKQSFESRSAAEIGFGRAV